MKKLLIAATFLVVNFTMNAQYTETINSNRPGNSQGAFSVGKNVFQIETGLRFGHLEHSLRNTLSDQWGIDYALRYGIGMERLEISLIGSFLSTEQSIPSGASNNTSKFSNFEYNTLGVKYLIYDPYRMRSLEGPNIHSWKDNFRPHWRDLIPAVSLYAGANLNLGDDNPYNIPKEPEISPKVALITQHNFRSWVLVMNFIGDKFNTNFPTYTGIFTLTHSFNSHFAMFGEYQAIKSDLYSDDIFRAGGAYLVSKNFQVDLAGLINFKDTPSRWQVAVGVSYRLDMHNIDEFIIPKEDKEKQKKEEETKKEQEEFQQAKPGK